MKTFKTATTEKEFKVKKAVGRNALLPMKIVGLFKEGVIPEVKLEDFYNIFTEILEKLLFDCKIEDLSTEDGVDLTFQQMQDICMYLIDSEQKKS